MIRNEHLRAYERRHTRSGARGQTFLLHVEATHGDLPDADDVFRSIDGVSEVSPGRGGELPTSILLAVRRAASPAAAIDSIREAMVGDAGGPNIFFEPAPTIVRHGWLLLSDLADGNAVSGWNWNTIAHDCTENDVKIVHGLVAPGPDWDWDEYELGGCQPGGPRQRCRVCGCSW